jgi:hypothetical protein
LTLGVLIMGRGKYPANFIVNAFSMQKTGKSTANSIIFSSAIYHRLTDLHGCFPVRFIFHGNKVKFAGGFPFNYSRGSWCPWNRIDLQNMNAVNWLLNEKAIPPHSRRAGSVLPLFKSCRVQESCKCALPLSCPFINSCIEQHA